MRVRTQCRACGFPFLAELSESTAELPCPNCEVARPVAREGWTDSAVDVCPLCDCRHLYRQRDFNRALGCLLVVASRP